MTVRRALLGLAILLLSSSMPAVARTIAQADLDQNGFKLYGLPLTPDRASGAATLRFVTPGAGILKATGLDGSIVNAIVNVDFLNPSYALGGQLGGTPASATVLGLRETGGPTLIPYGAIPSNSFLFNSGGSSIVGVTTIPSTALGLTADWAIAGERVYCVDAASGNDANLGYATSADQTLANVGAATATCGTVAKQTWSGLMAIIPPSGMGRTMGIVVASGTYSDPLDLLDRAKGYALITQRTTATNSTASSVKFAGDANDIILDGAVTAAGANAAGYNPTSSTTSDTISLALVGGGSPSFGAEPAMPVGYRVRFDNATFTSARRNQVLTVVERVNATTVRLNSSIAFNTSDVLYIEQPGAVFSSSAIPTFAPAGNSSVRLSGVIISGLTQNGGTLSASFVQSAGQVTATNSGALVFSTTGFGFGSTVTVGPNRFATAGFFAARVSGGLAVLATTGNVTCTSCTEITLLDKNVIGGDLVLIGGGNGVNGPVGAISTIGGAVGAGSTANIAAATRILGKIDLRGARVTFKSVNLPTTTQSVGVKIAGTNDVVFQAGPYGGTKTDVGVDASQSAGSRITFVNPTSGGSEGPTLTGVNADWYGGTNSTVGGGAIYASWVGLTQNGGAVMLPSGDMILGAQGSGSQQLIYQTTGPLIALAVFNQSGADTPVDSSGRGMLVHGDIVNDSHDIAVVQADSLAHAGGWVGQALGSIKNGKSGYAITTGSVYVCYSDGPTPCQQPGSTTGPVPVYLSEVAGKVRITPPSSPSVARQIGWATGETTVLLVPDNQAAMPHYSTGVLPTAIGYVKSIANSAGLTTSATVPWADITGAPAAITALTGDVTATGPGSVPATIAANAVTLPKIVNFITDSFPCRDTAGTGNLEVCAVGGGIEFTGGPGIQRSALTGDITASAGSGTTAFRNFTALSVLGRSANSLGAPGDIFATAASGAVLRESGSTIGFGTIATAGITNNAVTYAKVQQAGAQTLLGNPTGSTANVSEITLGAGLVFSGTTLVATGSGGITQLTGDVTAGPGSGSQAATVVNLPTGVTMAGYLAAAAIAAPSTPGAGIGRIYVDSTSKNLAVKDDAGVVKHGVQTRAAVSHQFMTAISDAGVASLAQPDYSDISGTPLDLSGMHFITTQAETGLSAETSLGALNNGTLQQTISAGVATISAFNGTTGSVAFYTTNGQLSQDVTNFFWDATNHSLGVGGGAPSTDRLYASGRVRFDSSVNVTGVPTDADHSGLFLNANTSDAQLSFGRDGTMTGSIMGKASTMAYFAPAAGTKDHTFYFDSSIGAARFYASMTPGATNPVVSINPSGLDVAALSAGGITKAVVTTGRLAIASAADIAAAQTWPTAAQFLYSSGTTTAPVGNTHYTYDTGADYVTVTPGAAFAMYNLGTSDASANIERVRMHWSSNTFVIDSERTGTGTMRGIDVNAHSANVTLTGAEIRASTLTGGGYVGTDFSAGTGAMVNASPPADLVYMIQLDTVSIANLNSANQYITTSSDTNLYGATAVEYPINKTVPSYVWTEACLVGPNTISSGEVNVTATANGSNVGVTLNFTSSSTGCLRGAGTNFGGTATDKVGVQLTQSTSIITGRQTAILTGNLRIAIRVRFAPLSGL